ncbi:MAG: winged helix-turn-helix transcriptional regulator [Halieaceae bacterium]|jgi:ArsR family transcriptional regulator, virulence genes transcriptional regulator|nr:winged helix-turn-helix transcriptional regulator [Halieaceae bacterium]
MDLEKMQQSAKTATDMLKLLGHPDRLMVLCQLKTGEQSVGKLSNSLGIKQSPLSQHLARMRHEGVVESRREAQTIYYSLAGEKVEKIVSVLYELYCDDDN